MVTFVLDKERIEAMEYIIYCDESVSDGKYYSDFFGGVLVRNTHIDAIREALDAKKRELNLSGEIKWVKVTGNYLEKYKQMMDLFADFYADFDRDRASEMLARLGIGEDMRIRQMSKGTREKAQLIMVMSRRARLYLLDEPIGGVDPATRDYILETIIRNYDEEASVLISTHLISDVENVLDDVIFLNNGKVTLQSSVDDIREQYGKSVDALFREVFRC